MNYSCPRSPSGQILAFPVTIATSGGWPSRARAVAHPCGAPKCLLERENLRASAAPDTAGWIFRLSLVQNGPGKLSLS